MKLRRGFKTEAESIAREIREELKLTSVELLDPWVLAEHLAIPVLPLSSVTQLAPEVVRRFQRSDRSAFSALTVFDGTKRLIVHNDAHSKRRQASNLAHELAHALLLHPPTPPLNEHGCRNWNEEIENEANWLGGTLLVPEEAALFIARNGWALAKAAEEYGVSDDMIRFRLNVTGARRRVQRSRSISEER